MKEHCRNIYQTARRAAGMTQERWAEHVGVSVEAVRQYEGGIIMPSDEVVLRMAEISGMLILPYWHLTRKSRIAAAILPELGEKRLPEAVLGLLTQIDDFREDGMRKLLRIAADGKVNDNEIAAYEDAMQQLTMLVEQALALGFAK